jgi:hypothetical protein
VGKRACVAYTHASTGTTHARTTHTHTHTHTDRPRPLHPTPPTQSIEADALVLVLLQHFLLRCLDLGDEACVERLHGGLGEREVAARASDGSLRLLEHLVHRVLVENTVTRALGAVVPQRKAKR